MHNPGKPPPVEVPLEFARGTGDGIAMSTVRHIRRRPDPLISQLPGYCARGDRVLKHYLSERRPQRKTLDATVAAQAVQHRVPKETRGLLRPAIRPEHHVSTLMMLRDDDYQRRTRMAFQVVCGSVGATGSISYSSGRGKVRVKIDMRLRPLKRMRLTRYQLTSPASTRMVTAVGMAEEICDELWPPLPAVAEPPGCPEFPVSAVIPPVCVWYGDVR